MGSYHVRTLKLRSLKYHSSVSNKTMYLYKHRKSITNKEPLKVKIWNQDGWIDRTDKQRLHFPYVSVYMCRNHTNNNVFVKHCTPCRAHL